MRMRVINQCLVGASLVGLGFYSVTAWSHGGGSHSGGSHSGGSHSGGSHSGGSHSSGSGSGGRSSGGAGMRGGSHPSAAGPSAAGAFSHTAGSHGSVGIHGGSPNFHSAPPIPHVAVSSPHGHLSTGHAGGHPGSGPAGHTAHRTGGHVEHGAGGHPGFGPGGHAGHGPGGHAGHGPGGHPEHGPGGHHEHGPGGVHETHYAGMLHSPGQHWNGYHQSHIGHHPVHLAYPGYRPSYYYHPWYHGPWRGYGWGWGWGFGPGVSFGAGGAGWGLSVNNGYGPYGPYGYSGYPLGWGYGGWGLGGNVYSSGYYPYYNPYYPADGYRVVVYDYSRPIPVVTQAPPGSSPDGVGNPIQPINPAFDAARQAFREGDYDTALSGVDLAIAEKPSDSVFHEFRALVLFARRDYRKAAATLHSLLSIGPGWDWTTMSSLYADPLVYAEQLQTLENYSRAHLQAADAHFVLGYHYMIGSHKEEAVTQLQLAAELMPTDRLAAELVRMVQGPARPPTPDNKTANDNNNTPQPMPDPTLATSEPSVPAIDKSLLPGKWQASRPDGSKFALALTEEGKFQWKFTIPNQPGDEFGGTYSVDGSILILERPERGALAGTMTFADEGHFNFKLVGAPPDDKGLDFGK
jgi:tetratricopeptide (TPR) repeat protein